MSFSSQRDVHYFIDQFHYWLLIRCIKTPVTLKHQQFEESGSDETEPRESKRQHLDERDNEKRNGLNDKKKNSLKEDEGEIEGGRYILPPFVLLPLLS